MYLLLRRIDLVVQAVIGLASLISLLFTSPLVCIMGELVLGIWQFLSAALNTKPMLQTMYNRRITMYWIFSLTALVLVIIPVTAISSFAIVISWVIAGYYWFVYRSFINYLAYRRELSTIVRHH